MLYIEAKEDKTASVRFFRGLDMLRFQSWLGYVCQGQRGGIYSESFRASFQTGRADSLWMF
jgi:hypothetical protein